MKIGIRLILSSFCMLMTITCMQAGNEFSGQAPSSHATALEHAENNLKIALQAEQEAEAAINTTWGLRSGPTQERLKKAITDVETANNAYEELLSQDLPNQMGNLIRLASKVITAGEKAEKSIAIAQAKRATYEKSWNPLADEKPIVKAESRAKEDAQSTKAIYTEFKQALAATPASETPSDTSWQGFKINLADAAGDVITRKIDELEKAGQLYAKQHAQNLAALDSSLNL